MNSSDFAKSQGFSAAYVTKLVKQGIIKRDSDGQIDEAEAAAALAAHRDPARPQQRAGRPTGDAGQGNESLSTLLLRSRIKTELERGKSAEFDRRKREKELVDAQQVREEQLRRATDERDALLAWPSRIADALAGDLDVEKAQLLPLLRKYIRIHLAERSKQ